MIQLRKNSALKKYPADIPTSNPPICPFRICLPDNIATTPIIPIMMTIPSKTSAKVPPNIKPKIKPIIRASLTLIMFTSLLAVVHRINYWASIFKSGDVEHKNFCERRMKVLFEKNITMFDAQHAKKPKQKTNLCNLCFVSGLSNLDFESLCVGCFCFVCGGVC